MTPPLHQLRDLKAEPPDAGEIAGLIRSAESWLADAENKTLTDESRFTLAYSAAHATCLAALRRRGYRTHKRYLVFQLLPETLGLGSEVWRVLDRAHERRNLIEYEGMSEIEPRLLDDTLSAARAALAAWRQAASEGNPASDY